MDEDKRWYLWEVERFCTQAGNDWYRVYLVRKLASRQGMEFVHGFSRPGHLAQWVFPKEVISQQVRGLSCSRGTACVCSGPLPLSPGL